MTPTEVIVDAIESWCLSNAPLPGETGPRLPQDAPDLAAEIAEQLEINGVMLPEDFDD